MPSTRTICLLASLVALAFSAPAFARPAPVRAFVVGAGPGQTPSTAAVQARLGETVRMYAVVQVGRGRRAVYFTDAPQLRVGRRVPAKRVRPSVELGQPTFRWSLVEPRQQHVETPAPNAPNPAYSNSILFGPGHGRWLGYDTLEYTETPLGSSAGSTLSVNRSSPTDRVLQRNGGLGTMRYKVTVTLNPGDRLDARWSDAVGPVVSSPGAESTQRGGIRTDVFRVSFRRADDLVGWLTSYFNVPNVFGSAGHGAKHQTDRYQGADCADVIVGAARRGGARLDYTSAAGLTRYAKTVSDVLLVDETGVYTWVDDQKGEPVSLAMPTDIRAGDIVLIDYVGFDATGRSWDHVGVLSADAGRPGLFDPSDPLLHIGYLSGLVEVPLQSQGPALIQVLRLKKRHQRAIERYARKLAR